MEYNTSKSKLILPEYGRNIQMMVESLKEIENRDERNEAAKAIINIMGNLNPHLRDINDFRHKLWDHLFILADFDLDIDSPYTIPTRETFAEKPRKVAYNQRHIQYKHFGYIVTELIKKAIALEDGAEKDALLQVIATHMRKAYLMWNKDSVNDEAIVAAIAELSEGILNAENSMQTNYSNNENINRLKRRRISKK